MASFVLNQLSISKHEDVARFMLDFISIINRLMNYLIHQNVSIEYIKHIKYVCTSM